MIRLIRRTLMQWEAWKAARRVRRAYPDIASHQSAIAENRRRHARNRASQQALRDRVHDNLRRETAR